MSRKQNIKVMAKRRKQSERIRFVLVVGKYQAQLITLLIKWIELEVH